MSDIHHEPSRLDLYKAGKLEERRSPRPPYTPELEVVQEIEEVASFKLRPEIIAIALMVVVLLVLTLTAM